MPGTSHASKGAATSANGRAYVLDEYSWAACLDRFVAAMQKFGLTT